jgi:hypothetical protein
MSFGAKKSEEANPAEELNARIDLAALVFERLQLHPGLQLQPPIVIAALVSAILNAPRKA